MRGTHIFVVINATATAPTHGPVEIGARTPPGRAQRRRAHAPGQAEGAVAEGLRGGTDACAGGWQVRGRVARELDARPRHLHLQIRRLVLHGHPGGWSARGGRADRARRPPV